MILGFIFSSFCNLSLGGHFSMSVDGEVGLATQPEDDDSKCAMARVGESATDNSSVKSEDY
jgi:hypothetical protein